MEQASQSDEGATRFTCSGDSRFLQIQRDLGVALSEIDTLDRGLEVCIKTALDAAGADAAGIYLFDEATRTIELVSHAGLSEPFVSTVRSYGAGSPQLDMVSAGEPWYGSFQPQNGSQVDIRAREGLRAMAVVPIKVQGEVIACFNIASRHVDAFTEAQSIAIETIAAQVGSAIARLRLSEEVAASEERYRVLFNEAIDAVIIHEFEPDGRPGRIVEANEAACRTFQRSLDTLLHTSLFDLAEVKDSVPIGTMSQTLISTGQVAFEARAKRPDGAILDLEIHAHLVELQGTLTACSIIRDITERNRQAAALERSRQEMQALAARLSETSEAERRRVASELHDGVTQTVAGITFRLSAIRQLLPSDTPQELIDRLVGSIRELGNVSTQIRAVIAALRPTMLEDLGLMTAIEAYAELLEQRYLVPIHMLGGCDVPPLPDHCALALFRIAQEAMSNACRHASPSRVDVSLQQDESGIRLEVRDDGCGFLVDEAIEHQGYRLGLATMRERSTAIGAELSVDSAPGKGVRIGVLLRLDAEREGHPPRT